MNLKVGIFAAAASLLAVAAFAAVESGLKPGAAPGAFQVVDVTGPNKGKELCYRCRYGAAPVVAAFVKNDTAKATSLIVEMQKLVDARKEKGLQSFVVFMSGPEAKVAIQKIAAEKKITIPLVFLPKGASAGDIASYKISPEATNTVLLWRGSRVHSNFVNVDASKVAEVAKAADTMLE